MSDDADRPAGGDHREMVSVPALSFRGITKTFTSPDGEDIEALKAVDLDVAAGEFVCFIGPSGCGKSTLLSISAGLLTPTRGDVHCSGKEIITVNTGAGYLTQGDTLLPWRSVSRNVGLPLEVQGLSKRDRSLRVENMLELVGLTRFAGHFPAQLSGGMRKRTLLARTLIYEPDLLLLDEPFGALDAQLRLQLQTELLHLWQRTTATVVFVTHDLEEALLLADRIVIFASNPGRVVHVYENHLPRPRNALELKGSPEFGRAWQVLWEKMTLDLT